MKFRKFGKALLMSALSVGAVFSATSCVQSYTVGFLYVVGTQTSGSAGQGVISGFKIDHNTGKLISINGLPIASGGANPSRAVLIQAQRFLYVLNRGVDASGGSNCTSATSPCKGANIVQFAVGANGILSQQGTFYTQGNNPFRLLADASGGYLYVLDHDAPSASACSQVLGSGVTSCGDITVLKVDQSTGRLSVVVNAQATSANGGASLPYFPVPANSIDAILASNYLLVLSGTPATGDFVFPYAYNSTGQLTVSQNSIQPLNVAKATAIQAAAGNVYVLDDEPITVTINGSTKSSPSQLLPFTVGTGGSLQAQVSGAIPDTAAQSNPIAMLAESKTKWIYVANQGDNANTTTAQSGIVGYDIDTNTKTLYEMTGSPFGTGAGPQCIVEDPSDQFIYTANFNSSSVTGLSLDQNSGLLRNLPGAANKAYGLPGPATWCLVDGRTH